jgi:hypothetical protein
MKAIAVREYKTVEDYDEDLEFILPGQGQPYEWCGQWYWIGHFKKDKLHWVRVKRSCHRFECPVCWHDWQKREARAGARRLNSYSIDFRRRMVHYVLSPPGDVPHKLREFRRNRQEAYRIAKSRGIRGGIIIYHERACRYYDEKVYTESHSGFHGSHWHIIGDGWLHSVAELYKKDGWIVKNLRIRRRGGVFHTLTYLLDHCLRAFSTGAKGIDCHIAKVRIHTVTWFGVLSYNKLKIEKEIGPKLVYCPICEEGFVASDWFILRYQGASGPPGGEQGESEIGPDAFALVRPLTTPFWW